MKCNKSDLLLYAVTDRRFLPDGMILFDAVEAALRGGVTMVQLREKDISYPGFLDSAVKIQKLCAAYHVPLIINDDFSIVKGSGASGLHIGQGDMPVAQARKLLGDNRILGVSAHTVEQAIQAERDGADYLGVGALFSTQTKDVPHPVSSQLLSEISRAVSIPVVAIGGIKLDNIQLLAGTGIAGVAVVSAIFGVTNVEECCREFVCQSQKL